MTETLAGILGDKNFDMPNMNFESLTLESYEASGRRYAFVEYVPVEEILSEQRAKAERLLKERLRKFKLAAANFSNDFQVCVMGAFNRPAQTQDNNARELQKIQQAVESKTKTLASYKRKLDTLRNFGRQLESLLEINP